MQDGEASAGPKAMCSAIRVTGAQRRAWMKLASANTAAARTSECADVSSAHSHPAAPPSTAAVVICNPRTLCSHRHGTLAWLRPTTSAFTGNCKRQEAHINIRNSISSELLTGLLACRTAECRRQDLQPAKAGKGTTISAGCSGRAAALQYGPHTTAAVVQPQSSHTQADTTGKPLTRRHGAGRARLRHVLAQAAQAQAEPLGEQRRRAARARARRAQRRQQHVQQAGAGAQRLRARPRQAAGARAMPPASRGARQRVAPSFAGGSARKHHVCQPCARSRTPRFRNHSCRLVRTSP
jgi:hypothetical protein